MSIHYNPGLHRAITQAHEAASTTAASFNPFPTNIETPEWLKNVGQQAGFFSAEEKEAAEQNEDGVEPTNDAAAQ